MYKFLLIFLLGVPLMGLSQEKLSFAKVDSLSYQYYLKGDWQKLIHLTESAFNQQIESKFMHQRAGYAYFMTGDFTAAEIQYGKALEFDQGDELTKEFLYYSSLNSGSANQRLYAGALSPSTAQKLEIQQYSAVELIDTEFNLKINQSASRSNQSYYRIGINSNLGYHFSIYQAFSNYQQTVNSILTRQPEYLAVVKWIPNKTWRVRVAYHHLFTQVGTSRYPGNLGLIALGTQWKRFSFEVNSSILTSSLATTQQTGLLANVVLPGRYNIYLTGSLVGMYEDGSFRPIYSQTAGLKCSKKLWAEGNITFGNLKNYNTYSSLYIYNSADPTLFRTGLSLTYFAGKRLSVMTNFTFDRQKIESVLTNNLYYQYSFSGGLKWRL